MRALQLSAQGAELYSWVPNVGLNNSKIADPVATLTKNTSYTVIGTDSKNCFTDSAHVSVVVVANPQFDIIDTSISFNAGTLYTIKTSSSADVVKWQWTPPTDLSCNNCPQPQARIDKVSQYTGTAYNSFGCTATDKIKIESLCNNQVLFIPNTFSPNGDSRNDRFYPRGNGIYAIKSMRIFTKLGQPVFQKLNFAANAENEGWDGTNYGKKLPSDVYIYYIEVMCNSGTIITLKGDITLLL
jgi:gliding motility-associated-like protein